MIKHTAVSYYGFNYVEHAEKDFIEMKEHGCDTVILAITEFDMDFWFPNLNNIVKAAHELGLRVIADTWGIGKYFGARWSAKASGCDENIVKYLGITLFPQAGVALGMASQALTFGGEIGVLAQSITLFAVLIYELFGPLLTRQALMTAGEIHPIPEHVKNRRKHKLEEAKNREK